MASCSSLVTWSSSGHRLQTAFAGADRLQQLIPCRTNSPAKFIRLSSTLTETRILASTPPLGPGVLSMDRRPQLSAERRSLISGDRGLCFEESPDSLSLGMCLLEPVVKRKLVVGLVVALAPAMNELPGTKKVAAAVVS